MLWSTKSVHQPLRRVLATQFPFANSIVLGRINRMSVPYNFAMDNHEAAKGLAEIALLKDDEEAP